ncbi:ParB/RepB/Spo0J family partition protein [Candidatus Saccharibacteria bacterium]|nr:ParB/RepB/Spo0J family partition protein [Candidatus Saccharibacteria bacterium]
MSTKQKGLGKGFEALMPQGFESVLLDKKSGLVQMVAVSSITPNPDQPRRLFDETSLHELAESIKQFGLLQPLILTQLKNDSFQIIAGERRWRASKLAGLKEIPAIVRTVKELEQLEMAIVENIQRVDLTPLEQAVSISRLHEIFSLSYDAIAKRLGKAESTVHNIVRLLQLPPAAQDALLSQKITEGHARAILALKDFPAVQEQLLLLIQIQGWSVRQAEQFVVATKNGAGTTEKAKNRTSAITPETEQLTKILHRPVTLSRMAKGGRLVIRFKNDEDLDKLIKQIGSIKT